MGGIYLDVFQLPDGEYRLGQAQILEIIDLPKNWINRLHSKTPKQLERLQSKGFTGYTLEVSIEKTRAKTLTIDDATKIWGLVARSGNEKAFPNHKLTRQVQVNSCGYAVLRNVNITSLNLTTATGTRADFAYASLPVAQALSCTWRHRGRVAGLHCCNPAPSEPDVRLTTHPAQASH